GDAELLVTLGEPEPSRRGDSPGHQARLAPDPGAPVGLLHDAFLDQDPGSPRDSPGNDGVVGTDPEVVLVPLRCEVDAQAAPVQLIGADAAALVAVDGRLGENRPECCE